MNGAERALTFFRGGYNCAQSVFLAYCKDLGFTDEALALKTAAGFGAGMGRLQKTCGAVSGAIMLIGLKFGQALPDDKEAKEKTYFLVRELEKRFKAQNGTSMCSGLLGLDLLTADKEKITEKHHTVCEKAVHDATEIVGELLELEPRG